MPKCGRKNEGPPIESYLGGVMNGGFINRNAPFGTQYTPVVRTKIVGGKPRYVTETQRSFQLLDDKNTIPEHKQKRMQDDGAQTDSIPLREVVGETQSGAQNWHSHAVLPPIPHDSNFSHKTSNANAADKAALPPITTANGQRRVSDQPPQQGKALPNTELQRRSLQGQPPLRDISKLTPSMAPTDIASVEASKKEKQQYSPRTYDDHETVKDYQWKPAAGYSYLPTQPTNLSHEQEMFLLHKLSEDVAGCSLTQVRNVYQEMASNDHQLTGWGSYTELGLALQKHGIYPNLNTLRLLASTCVSTTDIGYIDYEKLLSFLITAVKKSKEQQADQQNFYSPRGGDSYSPVPDQTSSEGGLLRMVKQQLLQANATLDVEKLRQVFSKADRSHRLTLSQTQIKELCHRMNVPIDEIVINEMIAHCRSHGDGQYLWADFIDILEKVQPHATGLLIPQSKRPLEYAKIYLQPSENWPHPDPSDAHIEDNTQSYPEILAEPQTIEGQASRALPRAVMHQISAPAGFANRAVLAEHATISPRGLGVQQKTQPWSKNDPDPWFDGFKKMAEALYRNDLDKKGSMKPEKCNWLVTEYNEIYDLGLRPEDVERCIQFNTTASGTVIDGLLHHMLALR